MKNKMRRWKKVLLAVAILILLIIIIAIILFWRVIRTAASVEKLEDGLYSVEYQGDYHFDGFLEAGGASSDLAVADYVIQDIAYGLVIFICRVMVLGAVPYQHRMEQAEGCLDVMRNHIHDMECWKPFPWIIYEMHWIVSANIISIRSLHLLNGALYITSRRERSGIIGKGMTEIFSFKLDME